MKAVIVIDINDELYEDYDSFYVDYYLMAEKNNTNVVKIIKKVAYGHLKPLPLKRIDVLDDDTWQAGWNDCLKEILGDEHD